MRESANQMPKSPTIEVTLDGDPVRLAAPANTLPAIRSQLETIALIRQRILFAFEVDGVPVSLAAPMVRISKFHRVAGSTIGFEDLREQLAQVALEQIQQLRSRAEAVSLLVLINDWPRARQLWWDLVPDLKEPLLTLSFLCELPLLTPDAEPGGPGKLRSMKVEELGKMLGQIDVASTQCQALGLSDALEHFLLPWLDQLAQIIRNWNEPKAS